MYLDAYSGGVKFADDTLYSVMQKWNVEENMGMTFEDLLRFGRWHDRGKMPRYTVQTPRELGWAFLDEKGRELYFGRMEMTPLLDPKDYLNANGVNFADTGSFRYCSKYIHKLAFDPLKGQRLAEIIANLVTICKVLDVKNILIKGNEPEGQMMSRWFRWMKFPHPPILCLHRVRVPTP